MPRRAAYRQRAKRAIRERVGKAGTLRAAARQLGVNPGLLSQVLRDKCPPSNRLLVKLGLPPHTRPAPVCAHCGEVHVSPRCPKRRKPPKPRTDWKRACKLAEWKRWQAGVEILGIIHGQR